MAYVEGFTGVCVCVGGGVLLEVSLCVYFVASGVKFGFVVSSSCNPIIVCPIV